MLVLLGSVNHGKNPQEGLEVGCSRIDESSMSELNWFEN